MILAFSNRPFPFVPLFQNESKCKKGFDLHENEPVGRTQYQRRVFVRRGRFDTGKSNSEMANFAGVVWTEKFDEFSERKNSLHSRFIYMVTGTRDNTPL